MNTLYREDILEHARHPGHGGKLEPADVTASLANTTCGDEVTVYLKLDDNDTVTDARFEGRGCIISQAASDILCDALTQKPLAEIQKMSRERVLELFGSPVTPSRQTCALLAHEALKRKLADGAQ